MKATRRCATAVAVTLALVGAWAVAAAPTPSETDTVRGGDDALRAEAVQVPVTPDEGGHWVDEHGEEHSGEFTTFGTTWDDTSLTYGFVNHTPDVSVSAQEAAIESALDTWASVTPLTFTKVADCGRPFNHAECTTPDIRIFFGSGDHGDGPNLADFDGPGGTAAHGFYPPPNGASAAGDLHLDEAERWSTSGTGVDLESVSLHELGHSLGLTHASVAQCPMQPAPNRPIMCSTIIGVVRDLGTDDINGIQSLYGRPPNACGGRAVTVDLDEGQRPTNGDDVILGTPGIDDIASGGGSDIVCSGLGDDVVDLGPGNDRALTGSGNDTIRGRTGVDRVEGGPGNDRVWSGDQNDVLLGGTGSDTLDGGTGSDKLYGGSQGDSCNGRGGRDSSTGCERRAGIESAIR